MTFSGSPIYTNLGGIGKAHQALNDMSSLIPDSVKSLGITNWTGSPGIDSSGWWVIYSSLVLGVGIGVLAQPQLVVRYMTVKSDKEINRAVLIGSIFIMMTVGTAFIVGSLSNVYFLNTEGTISIAVAGGNSDLVIPTFIKNAMPSWFNYVFMLVILSAGMSTLSSQFHTIGTSIGRDFYSSGKADLAKESKEVLVTRIGIVVSILATVFLGINMEGGVIARATAIFFGLISSGLIPRSLLR